MLNRVRKTAVLWVNFGPYHLARLRALSKALDIVPIQLAAEQRLYGWNAGEHFAVETIFPGAYEHARPHKLAARIWKLFNRIQPQNLLIPGYSELPFLAAAQWGRSHSALNILMSDSTHADFPRTRWKEKAKALWVRRLFDRAIVSGTRASDYISSFGFPKSRIGRFYDVVDNQFFESAANCLRASSNRKEFALPPDYFLFVGRLVPAKNPETLIKSFASYRSSGGQSSLVIVGRGPLEEQLKTIAGSLGLLSQIQFRGFQSYEKLPAFYAFARCLVLPSHLEQWGLVVNEAMASSLPVILSKRCGSVDDLLWDGENGFVLDTAVEESLTQRLHQISSLSPERLTAMGANSRKIIDSYSLSAWCNEVVRMCSGDRSADPPPPSTIQLQAV